MARGEGDKCEVYGTITRAREIKRVGFATGPKGISFKPLKTAADQKR